MADVGTKISDQAIDVVDGNDEDMVVTSKFPVFKVHQEAADSLTLTAAGTSANEDVTHNLGAESIILAYAQNEDGDSDRLFVPGRTPAVTGGVDEVFVYAFPSDNSFNFRVSIGAGLGGDTTYNYYYYVMSDQISF